MKIVETKSLKIPELKIISYARFLDDRGYFSETYNKSDLKHFNFSQTNESYSVKNTVRGFHFQWLPYQGKLVRCITGHLIDFALDIRPDSATFGKVVGYELKSNATAEKVDWIWLPPGFAHGVIFPENTLMEYFCTSGWSPGNEATISPLAEDIDWSFCEPNLHEIFQQILKNNPNIADRDKNGMTLKIWTESPKAELFLKDVLPTQEYFSWSG